MTLILSNAEIEQVLTMPECMDTLEEAYVELAEGRGLTRTRSDCIVPAPGANDPYYCLKSMDGVIASLGVGAVRINSDIVSMRDSGDKMRREKMPVAPGGRYVGLVLLFSVENGEPLAIFPDGIVQRFRVGATSGLGVKHLSRKGSRTLGIIGSGGQAGTQLLAACAVRPIEKIRCFSPNQSRREAFCKTMTGALGIEVQPAMSPEDALKGVDIALCATSSEGPVFFEPWLQPGLHVGAIRKPEIENAAVERSDRVIIHTRDLNPITEVSVDIKKSPVAERRASKPNDINIAAFPTLGELIAGKAAGRGGDDEITCFMNNLGLGFQFAAAGAVAYRKAKKMGVGRELPTEWFTEDICP